jgi:hypothetical protein
MVTYINRKDLKPKPVEIRHPANGTMFVTNELKSGDRIRQRNGWEAVIKDNMRGIRRMAEVYGLYTETGSIYSHDITEAFINGVWQPIQHTEEQLKCKDTVESMGY